MLSRCDFDVDPVREGRFVVADLACIIRASILAQIDQRVWNGPFDRHLIDHSVLGSSASAAVRLR